MGSSAAARQAEPRWPVVLSVLATVGLHFALPEALRIGPSWSVPAAVTVLVGAAHVTHVRGRDRANAIISYAILCILTAGLLFGVYALLRSLVSAGASAPKALLTSAAILWMTNVVVFAAWYWRLDAGGPNARERRESHDEGAFLFPQMTVTAGGDPDKTMAEEGWRPHFVDYLFVAFSTSTAFSPTDSPVLSRWAKLAMMIQSLISFTTVVVVAARAVNSLPQ